MIVENAVLPRPDQIQALLGLGGDAPIVMLNLLKFRQTADYEGADEPPATGREAYMRYGDPMRRLVEAQGGRFVFSGRIDALAIGEVGELWDVAALGHHRKAGLAGQLLIQVSEIGDA